MSSDSNLKTVQMIYDAFGRGDVQAILDQLTDDVDFASEPDQDIAPWHGRYSGKAEVPRFFQALAETIEVTEFNPLAFATSDSDVMAVIRFGFTVNRNGRSGAMDLHHWWRFRDGKVYFYRGTEDTAKTAAMLA
jgi:ketosteroid isomerase-like protein